MNEPSATPQPQPTLPQGDRSHFGGDDWLTRYPAGHRPAFRIDCAFAKPGWRPRQEASHRLALHPGTALQLEGNLYEVMAYKASKHTPPRHLYYLTVWDETLTPAPPEDYTPERAEQYALAMKEASRRQQKSWTLFLLAPIFSLLPAEDQERLDFEYDYPATWACRLTASITLSFAIAGWLWTVWAIASGGVSRTVAAWVPYMSIGFRLLAADSFVRFAGSLALGSPVGSAFIAGPVHLWRALKQALSRDERTRTLNQLKFERTSLDAWHGVHDEVRQLELCPDTNRPFLEIRSQLGKPHWTLNRTGVRYQGQWYLPIEREEIDTEEPDQPRHRFVLEPVGPDQQFSQAVEYDPSEIGALLYQQLQAKRGTAAQTFGLFLGLLEEEEKRTLERLYQFDVERQTRVSLIWQIGIAIVVLWWASSRVSLGESLLSHTIDLLAAGYALFEGARRYAQIRRGEAPGSLFGIPVRFLARPLFDFPEGGLTRKNVEDGLPADAGPSDPFDRPIR